MKIPQWIIPALIVIVILVSVQGSKMIQIPSAELELNPQKNGTNSVRAVFIVDGVTCRDTAISVMENLKGLEGAYRAIAYASHNRIDVEFDPEVTDTRKIADTMEDPVFIEETGEFLFNLYTVVEVNGEPVKETK